MPSSSWPYVLRTQRRKTKLVLLLRDNVHGTDGARSTDANKGADVIQRSDSTDSKLWHVQIQDNEQHDGCYAITPSKLSSPSPYQRITFEMSLNAEPAAPEERQAQHLPPKSYAEAAEEAISSDDTKSHDIRTPNKARNVKNIQTNGQIMIPSDKEWEEYEGRGEDDSPKSPTRRERRKSSIISNGSIGRKHGVQLDFEVYEKYPNGNGKPLTSVKPPEEAEKFTPATKPEKGQAQESKLMSGRQAGAGWHKSKYVSAHTDLVPEINSDAC